MAKNVNSHGDKSHNSRRRNKGLIKGKTAEQIKSMNKTVKS